MFFQLSSVIKLVKRLLERFQCELTKLLLKACDYKVVLVQVTWSISSSVDLTGGDVFRVQHQ